MAYDRAELEQAIRAGDSLPKELLDMLKESAAHRRSGSMDRRMREVVEPLRDSTSAGKVSPFRAIEQRLRRGGTNFPPGKSHRKSDPPPPSPLACLPGWTRVDDRSAPFSWGSQETPLLGPSVGDDSHQWSVMTRRHTGEFSLALVVDSDPNSAYSPTAEQGLGFKGVSLSATIGQIYSVPPGPLVVLGQARLAMNGFLSEATRVFPGDVFAVTQGSVTLTVSQSALEFTGTKAGLPSVHFKLLGQSSTEAELLRWGAEPDGHVFINEGDFTPGPLDLSATLACHSDAFITSIDVDIQLFAGVRMSANSLNPAAIYHDFRVDDDDLIVGPESADGYPGEPLPYPSPFQLTEVKLCSFP